MTGTNHRRQNYETRMREAGFVKVTVWASASCAEEIKRLAALSRGDRSDGPGG